MIVGSTYRICSQAHWFSCIYRALVSAIQAIINLLLGDASTSSEEVRIQLLPVDHGVDGVAANAHDLCDLGGGKVSAHNLLDKFWYGFTINDAEQSAFCTVKRLR